MPKLRYLKIRFNQTLHTIEIPKFRAAVIEKTERVSSLFHNHKNDTEVLYRYPLIQYKITNKKASIVCLESGTDDIHHLLQNRDLDLRIGNKTHTFQIEDVDLHYHNVHTTTTIHEYKLSNWLALNQKNKAKFDQIKNDKLAQLFSLEKILCGNILSFGKGVNWKIEDRINIEITNINKVKTSKFKQESLLSFDIHFKSNISLPDFIGLGKGSSIGFGVIEKI